MLYRSKRKKPAPPSALYKPGDILLFKSEMDKECAYKILFILEVWKVKSIHYRIITIQQWNGRWGNPEIIEQTEYKLTHCWGRQWQEVDRDLGFLCTNGSHVSIIESLICNGNFKQKIEKRLREAKKRVASLEERLQALDRAKELLEARYERIDPKSTQ